MADPVHLESCPFCGGAARIERRGDFRCSTIYSCTNCGCRLETCEERDHGEEWNRRAAPSETLREALTNLVLAVEAGRPDVINKGLSHARAALGETGGTDG